MAADEASRRWPAVAARTAAGRSDLSEAEAELAGTVIDLRSVREQARALAARADPGAPGAEAICPFKGLASYEPADAELFFGRERLLSPSSSLASPAPASSASSAPRAAASRPSCAPACSRPSPTAPCPAAVAGGRCCCVPASAPWTRCGARWGRVRRIPSPTRSTRCPPARVSCSRSISSRSSSPPAARTPSARPSSTRSPARRRSARASRRRRRAARRLLRPGRRLPRPGRAARREPGPGRADAGAELRRVVELPAGRVGLRVEPELTDALIADVEGEPGALPLLSTALHELWQKRQDGTLTLEAYRESGRVHGAVARLAEATYASIPDERSRSCGRSCCASSARARPMPPVRRRAPLDELDLDRDGEAADVLATLADSASSRVGDGSVEVAHEALLREWPRLRGWIEEDAEGRRLHRTSARRRATGTPPAGTRPSSTAVPASRPRSTGAPSTRST